MKKKKGVAWFFVVIAVVGIASGVIYTKSDLAVQNKFKMKFNSTIETLDQELIESFMNYRFYSNSKVVAFRFGEPQEKTVPFEAYVSAKDGDKPRYGIVYYDLALKYYSNLVLAEEQNDANLYLECLNECFKHLQYVDGKWNSVQQEFDFTQEEATKFNEMFNLNERGLKQVGFLPHFISYNGKTKLDNGMLEISYTFKGLSFVDVGQGLGDGMLPKRNSKLILNSGVKASDVEIYETDFTMTVQIDPKYMSLEPYKMHYLSIIRTITESDFSQYYHIISITNDHCKKASDSFLGKMQNGDFSFVVSSQSQAENSELTK